MAKIGFGTYRVSDQNQAHLDALSEAIRNGIDLIDTSTNYFDGGAERAIAKVFEKFDTTTKESVEIVSKYGYLQGSMLEEYKSSKELQSQFDQVVEFSDDCYHCISKEFLHHQLTRSLERLRLETIPCYLIHNPEYYMLDAINQGIEKEIYQAEMLERIYGAFLGLEEERAAGRIRSYGISSNSFAKPKDAPDFLPYDTLMELAQDAARSVGNEECGFTTIELPINIVEKEGLHCAFWAKEQGLRVLANRPLNGVYNGAMYRLAEYESSRDYYMYLNELLEFCDNELLEPIYNIVQNLDESMHKFGFVGNYDSFVHTQVLPHLQRSLKDIDGDTQEKLIQYLEYFLHEYRNMVAYESGESTKKVLAPILKNCNDSLQNCALKYLLQQESIDYVLVGARRVRYVYDILALRDELA